MISPIQKYLTVQKLVGETPLQALERLRTEKGISRSIPLAYAGRLDPMASGTLLVLVGDECKVQERYHSLDKEYVFEILFGITSDTHDVLGIVKKHTTVNLKEADIQRVLSHLEGEITLPYPHFSSKTVHGKPLHTWALEGRLDEITVPEKKSILYSLVLVGTRTIDTASLQSEVLKKISSIPPVTDPGKSLGRDFRRTDVRASWNAIRENVPTGTYTIATIRCIASSGTYMRTLASVIAERLGTQGLAFSIHRTRIGIYTHISCLGGFFRKVYQ